MRIAELVVDLADRKLGIQAARHVRWFAQPQRRLRGLRQRDDTQPGQVALRVLITTEEMRLVANDRSSDVKRVHVDVGRRLAVLGMRTGCEEGKSHHRLPLHAIATLALDEVRPRRRDRVVDQTHGLAKLWRVAAGHDLHFTDHDLRHRHLPQPGAILLRVVAAIHLIVDAQQRAIGRQSWNTELVGFEPDHARLQQGKVVRIPRRQRQRFDLGLGDRAALFDLGQVDYRRVRRDRNRLGHGPH